MEFIFESELERQNTPHEHFVTVIKPTKTIVLGESILEHLCASIGEQVCPVTIVASNGDKTVGFYKTRYNNGYNLRRHSETSLCFSSVVTVNAILKLHKKEVADDDYSGHRFTNIKFVDMNIRGNTEKVALIL